MAPAGLSAIPGQPVSIRVYFDVVNPIDQTGYRVNAVRYFCCVEGSTFLMFSIPIALL